MANREKIIEGYFWQPAKSRRFYGRLRHDGADAVSGHFFDTDLTEPDAEGDPRPRRQIDVLHGEDVDGRPLSLLDVHPVNWSIHGVVPESIDTIEAVVGTVIRGARVEAERELKAELAVCSIHGLREFLTGGIVDGGVLFVPDEDLAADTLPVSIAEGVELLLVAHRRHYLDRHPERGRIAAQAQWTFEHQPGLDELERDYLLPLRDLVNFATRRQSYVLSLSVDPDIQNRRTASVIRAPIPRPRAAPEVYALALNLSSQADPAALIAKWFELRRRVGAVWSLFFTALGNVESLEDRFLGLLSFAEGFDRALRPGAAPLSEEEEGEARAAIRRALPDRRVRAVYRAAVNHANAPTLRERLGYLIERSLGALGGSWTIDAGRLRDELSDTRNWLTHWGSRGASVVEDAEGMSVLVRRLIVVLYINILLELGLEEKDAAAVIASGWRLEGLP